MTSFTLAIGSLVVASTVLAPARDSGQDMPPEYKGVLTTLGKTGDFKDGVLKVNIPRNDLKVTIDKRSAPTPFGVGGWVALTKGQGMDVMMGDLVLTEDEVNPVMSALLRNGVEVTALHDHFFRERPHVVYMHVYGMGGAADIAKRVKPAIDLINQAAKKAPDSVSSAPAQSSVTLEMRRAFAGCSSARLRIASVPNGMRIGRPDAFRMTRDLPLLRLPRVTNRC